MYRIRSGLRQPKSRRTERAFPGVVPVGHLPESHRGGVLPATLLEADAASAFRCHRASIDDCVSTSSASEMARRVALFESILVSVRVRCVRVGSSWQSTEQVTHANGQTMGRMGLLLDPWANYSSSIPQVKLDGAEPVSRTHALPPAAR